MEILGTLLILAAVIFSVYKLARSQASGSNWIAFFLGGGTGFLITGSPIVEGLQQHGGVFVGFIAAATFFPLLVVGIWDVWGDRTPNKYALTAAMLLPVMFTLGWPTVAEVVPQLLTDGFSNAQSAAFQ